MKALFLICFFVLFCFLLLIFFSPSLLCLLYLFFCSLLISVNIFALLFILPLFEPFVCLVCTQKIHHCSLIARGSDLKKNSEGPQRGEETEEKDGEKKKI